MISAFQLIPLVPTIRINLVCQDNQNQALFKSVVLAWFPRFAIFFWSRITEVAMARHKLTDVQWKCIQDLFPAAKRTGRPPTNPHTAFNAILWILRTGSPWRDLPEEYGKWRTIYRLYDK